MGFLNLKGSIGFTGVIELEDGMQGRIAWPAQSLGSRGRSLAPSSGEGWELTV